MHARTRGWVTALHLLRQTAYLAPGTPVPPASIFSRTEREVFDYFSEEVFAAEPPDVREFLMASSLPESVDLDACAAVVNAERLHTAPVALKKGSSVLTPAPRTIGNPSACWTHGLGACDAGSKSRP